jgi:hypothetical protein
MANGDTGPEVTPTTTIGWINLALNVALKLGVTAVIAMGLVWFLTQDVKNGLIEMRVAHAAMSIDLQKTSTTNVELLNKLDRIQRILTAMCVNAAGNDSVARASCVQ